MEDDLKKMEDEVNKKILNFLTLEDDLIFIKMAEDLKDMQFQQTAQRSTGNLTNTTTKIY
jgi:hypothetical protein